LGRFLQADPINESGIVNLYAYVANDPLNQVDPFGLYTLQIGLAGSVKFFGISWSLGFGLAVDTRGGVGAYGFGGAGLQVGAIVEGGVSVQVSDAKTIYDLSGRFNNVSLHGGAGFGGSLDLFNGSSANGPVTGGGFTFGLGAGASATISSTSTIVCGAAGCVGKPWEIFPSTDEISIPSSAAAQDTSSKP
jgi:hypothetical protein